MKESGSLIVNTTPPTIDISDFKFSLDSNKRNLKIIPKNASLFKDKLFSWRFQSTSGFENYEMSLELGRYLSEKEKSFVTYDRNSPSMKYYIVMNLANKGTATCNFQIIELDYSKFKKKIDGYEWTYKTNDQRSIYNL